MDWTSVSFDWNRARGFLVTAEEGSFSAAARALGMTQPTLGRQVAALEEDLGVVLFERVGTRLALTSAGLGLLEHVREMGEAAARLSLRASGQAQDVSGTVRISAGEVLAAHLLPPLLEDIRQKAPGLEIEVVATNSASDLQRREADIAMRNHRPSQPYLLARRLPDMRARLYASKVYLERIGHPETPEQVSAATFIGFDDPGPICAALNGLGLKLNNQSFPLRSDSHLVQLEMVRRGLGIGIVPEIVGDTDPGLARACPALAPIPFPMWLTTHRELQTSARIRLVFDALAEALSRPQPIRSEA